ncbi:MAG: molybdopterin-dependent oxidoreductase [Methanotrichaceae archaeon]|nr:molybdopterin-dependent oxidoreductase [Methanotrichaceae archaeon]
MIFSHPHRIASVFAAIFLLAGLHMLMGYAAQESEKPYAQTPELNFIWMPEIEATEYRGIELTPLSRQGNNAIQGTQEIDRNSYRLEVTGFVNEQLNLSYDELLRLPIYSEVAYMPCVEGWGFNAKWTGFRVTDLLNRTGLKEGARYVVFHSADGYSTSLPLDYLMNDKILMAYGINDLTLPPERGFPLQLIAKNKYGYKWAKWITKMELTDKDVGGYWESRGYSNTANVGEPPSA